MIKAATNTILKGIGQVMFQNNALSGLLMLVGIAISSWQTAVAALTGNIISNLTAKYVLKCPEEDIRNGLYGFNGTLTGIASWIFFGGTCILTSSVFAVILTMFFSYFRKPGYTAPFIISIWILFGTSSLLQFPQILPGNSMIEEADSPFMLQALYRNFGQVMFQGNVLTGLLFLTGIAVNDPRGAIFALYGAAFPLLTALFLHDYSDFNYGIWGYNAVLCSIALAGPSAKDFIFATIAIILSVLLQWLGMTAGVTTLTAPFVIATWLALILKKGVNKLANHPAEV